jgi:hypothetical protein
MGKFRSGGRPDMSDEPRYQWVVGYVDSRGEERVSILQGTFDDIASKLSRLDVREKDGVLDIEIDLLHMTAST